jgi:hypothetical protein
MFHKSVAIREEPPLARWPKYVPTENHRRQVLTMAGFGIRQEEIARILLCDKKTLRKYYRYELDTGMTEANVRVVEALFTNATKHNNVAAQIWWTKARMGWRGTDILQNEDAVVPQLIVRFGNEAEAPPGITFDADPDAITDC